MIYLNPLPGRSDAIHFNMITQLRNYEGPIGGKKMSCQSHLLMSCDVKHAHQHVRVAHTHIYHKAHFTQAIRPFDCLGLNVDDLSLCA